MEESHVDVNETSPGNSDVQNPKPHQQTAGSHGDHDPARTSRSTDNTSGRKSRHETPRRRDPYVMIMDLVSLCMRNISFMTERDQTG